MAWTSTSRVKNHLLLYPLPSQTVRDVPVQMDSVGKGQCPHRGILAGSERVKKRTSSLSGAEPVLLTATDWKSLSGGNLVPGEVVVSADRNAEFIFGLNLDYVVNWEEGKIRRTPNSAIGDGQTVQVWFYRYLLLTPGEDYEMDYTSGHIEQVLGGPQLADQLLWVDYEISPQGSIEGLVNQAIEEAEERIRARLKEEYINGEPPPGLVNGATELAVAVICRALATYALSDREHSPEGRCKGWLQLAQQYETVAFQSLKPFLLSPMMAPGGKSPNTSWEWL